MNDFLACELLGLCFLLFLWLTCAFEAFDGLSGGRIRKIETKDPQTAHDLEDWMERDASFRAVTKLLLFLLTAVIGALSYMALHDAMPDFAKRWGFAVIIAVVAAASSLSEIIARFILFRLDIFILRMTIPFLSFLCGTIFLPLTWLLNRVTKTTEDWHRQDGEEEKVSVEDEILSYVENYDDDKDNDLEEEEKQMIRGILDLGDKAVHEIMTPRVDLVALPLTASVADAKKLFIDSGHSRIPVYGRSLDEIRGIIYAKDFIEDSRLAGKSLLELSHKPIFVPETKEVTDLLAEIKRSRNHFAVIIDEYGGTSGIITFEDIIEEIVGEVRDEYDKEKDQHREPQLMPDGSIVLDARTPVSTVNDIADTDIPDDEDADTIGGFICSELGRIPDKDEIFTFPNQFRATVLNSDKRKILQLKLEILEDSENHEN